MASNILLAVCAAAVGWLAYFISKGYAQRKLYRNLPGPPHSWLWGHLKVVGEYTGKLPAGSYLQAGFAEIRHDFDLPDVFYLDLWPFGPAFVVMAGPEAAAFPTTVNTMAMAEMVPQYLADSIGTNFLEASNGALWKEVHQMLAPGFTPAAVRTYHRTVIDETKIMHDRFRRFAESDRVIDFSNEAGKMPFEVVFRVFFGKPRDTQNLDSDRLYDDTNRLADIASMLNSNGASRNPVKRWALRGEQKQVVGRIKAELMSHVGPRFAELQKEKVLPTRTSATSILDRMLLARVQSGLPLDERLESLILDNAKGLLVAGYATTADTLTFIMMLLTSFPDTLSRLREEHDRVFDKDFDKTLEMLRQDSMRIKELEYTTAVINETLRLFPIGMVVREPPADMEYFEHKGKKYPVKDHTFMISAYLIHMDPKIFHNPKEFRPERHLASCSSEENFPRNAFRPFERGLRSCVGQHLALDELRIALLMLARWFDFELRGHEPVDTPRLRHTDLDTKLGTYAFQVQKFAASSRTVHMKVSLAGGPE